MILNQPPHWRHCLFKLFFYLLNRLLGQAIIFTAYSQYLSLKAIHFSDSTDTVYLVLWYRELAGKPLYSFDIRWGSSTIYSISCQVSTVFHVGFLQYFMLGFYSISCQVSTVFHVMFLQYFMLCFYSIPW